MLLRDRGAYTIFNELQWGLVDGAYNSIASSGEDRLHYTPLPKDVAILENLARKRKLVSIVVHSVSEPSNAHKNHYLTLNGITTERAKTISIIDPADENRDRLDDPFYENEFRGIRYLENVPLVQTRLDGLPTVHLATSSPDLVPVAVVSPIKKLRIASLSERNLQGVDAVLTEEAIGSDEPEDSNSIGGYQLEIPNASVGTYSITVQASADIQGAVEVKTSNSSSQVNFQRAFEVKLAAGQSETITVDVNNDASINGSIVFSGYSKRKDITANRMVSRIEGHLNFGQQGDGINLGQEEVIINIGTTSFQLSPGSFAAASGVFVYLTPTPAIGKIRYAEFHANGEFVLELFDMDFFPLQSAVVPIEFRLGNDFLSGEFGREIQKADGGVHVNFAKAVFNIGDKANGKVYSTYRPAGLEDEVYLKLTIDGADNLVSKDADNIWSFASSRLARQGPHTVSSSLFIQNRREARLVEDSANAFNGEISKIDEQLKRETDPEVISDLAKRKQDLLLKVETLEYNLEKSRTQIGVPVSEIFYSN